MLYSIFRPVAGRGLVHYFRRIDVANADRIPENAAVILAANHPTTFIEPCAIACYLKGPMYFLVRGDFFKNPIAGAMLKSVNLIPVFRRQDAGFGGIKSNFKAFEKSSELLASRKRLMILAEGRCIHEKRLRPIQKIKVASAIKTPGIPNAKWGPYQLRSQGVSRVETIAPKLIEK